jgi:hypothetical protein
MKKGTNKNRQKLNKARSINEVLSIVDLIKTRLKNITKSSEKVLTALASNANKVQISLSAAREMEVGDIAPAAKKSGKSLKSKLDVNKFKTPSQKDLAQNSSLLVELNESIAELEVALRVIQSKQFAKFDNQRETSAMVRALIKEANATKKEQLDAMSKISKNYTPVAHRKVAKAVKDIANAEFPEENYSSIRVKTFILQPQEDTLYYQTFVVVQNLTNKEGYSYEDYSFVLTSVYDMKTGDMEPHLTALKDPKVPGSFPIGNGIDSLSDLKRRMGAIYSIDGVETKGRKLKLKEDTTSVRRRSIAGFADTVKGIRVKDKDLYIRLKKGTPQSKIDQIRNNLIPIFKSIFLPRGTRTKRVQWKQLTGKRSGAPFIVFSLSRREDTRSREFVSNVTEMAERMNLSPLITRDIVQKLVDEYDG